MNRTDATSPGPEKGLGPGLVRDPLLVLPRGALLPQAYVRCSAQDQTPSIALLRRSSVPPSAEAGASPKEIR